jgi:MFS family permease
MTGAGEATRLPRAHLLMALLYLGCLISYVDRQLIALLLVDIKRDLALEDWQLGFVSGTSFAVFYILAGIPLSRLADRTNRVRMLGICLFAWSLMTALCGASANVLQLALARVGVAVGEGGAYPTSLSLIGDIYPRRSRAMMTAIFFSATTAGALVALVAGGFLNDLFGWRLTLVAAAVPGILLAIVLCFLVTEPPRGTLDPPGMAAAEVPPSLWGALKLLFGDRFYRFAALSMTVFSVELFAITVWSPSYALRAFGGLSTSEVGLGLGLALGLGSGLVMIAGGRLGDLLSRRGPAAPVYVAIAGQVLSIPLLWLSLTAGNFTAFCLLFALAYGVMAGGGPMVIAATQTTVPVRLRGIAATLIVMLSTLAGLGLGPMLVGAISDLMPALAEGERLRRALLGGLVFTVAGILLLLITARQRRAEPV